jgi:hypothetical protein
MKGVGDEEGLLGSPQAFSEYDYLTLSILNHEPPSDVNVGLQVETVSVCFVLQPSGPQLLA